MVLGYLHHNGQKPGNGEYRANRQQYQQHDQPVKLIAQRSAGDGPKDHCRYGQIKHEPIGGCDKFGAQKTKNPSQPSQKDDHKYGNNSGYRIEHDSANKNYVCLTFKRIGSRI
jgi:hypothetical protein